MAVSSILYTLTGVADMAEYTNLKGCPHTFGNVVYACPSQTANSVFCFSPQGFKYLYLTPQDYKKVSALNSVYCEHIEDKGESR
jgi:hypothetical protein